MGLHFARLLDPKAQVIIHVFLIDMTVELLWDQARDAGGLGEADSDRDDKIARGLLESC